MVGGKNVIYILVGLMESWYGNLLWPSEQTIQWLVMTFYHRIGGFGIEKYHSTPYHKKGSGFFLVLFHNECTNDGVFRLGKRYGGVEG